MKINPLFTNLKSLPGNIRQRIEEQRKIADTLAILSLAGIMFIVFILVVAFVTLAH